MTIDSAGSVMPGPSEDALAVPCAMVESLAFWLAAL
jgi:hypothetical protein